VASLREQVDTLAAERAAAMKKAESLRRDVARMTAGSEELKSVDIEALARSKKSLEEKVSAPCTASAISTPPMPLPFAFSR